MAGTVTNSHTNSYVCLEEAENVSDVNKDIQSATKEGKINCYIWMFWNIIAKVC